MIFGQLRDLRLTAAYFTLRSGAFNAPLSNDSGKGQHPHTKADVSVEGVQCLRLHFLCGSELGQPRNSLSVGLRDQRTPISVLPRDAGRCGHQHSRGPALTQRRAPAHLQIKTATNS